MLVAFGPTISSITELLHMPNPLHNISMGHAQCHLCWWLLAVLPVRLPELECPISKQCLFLPYQPLVCLYLLTCHVKNRKSYLGIVSVYGLSFSGILGWLWEKGWKSSPLLLGMYLENTAQLIAISWIDLYQCVSSHWKQWIHLNVILALKLLPWEYMHKWIYA